LPQFHNCSVHDLPAVTLASNRTLFMLNGK